MFVSRGAPFCNFYLGAIMVKIFALGGTIGIPRKSSSPPTWFRGKYPVVEGVTRRIHLCILERLHGDDSFLDILTKIPHSSEQPLARHCPAWLPLSVICCPNTYAVILISVLDLDASESAGYTAQGQSRGP
ncbi:hypothetical protein B0H17DRAFT_1154650 [Mycena rosella]|uniref:Uncharacterized protein n=1 Tax=Mycena rosella TaxID=1033263 RepID=A0AAD7AXS0_MYCRO|nr:hypothetical protein B0H17DRAFT_1154650 [Mycena rosella]